VLAGIKASPQLDLALVVSDQLASAAGVFTTNRAQAAPVLLSKMNLDRSEGRALAIVCNSGCANACTGDAGFDVSRSTAEIASRLLNCRPEEILVASTGVIGVNLDLAKVSKGVAKAASVLSKGHHHDAARAIMTTDPWPKEHAVSVETAAGTFHVGGMAKGSGMIEPLMATMIAVVTTDARISPALLRRALVAVTDVTFNAISVDGECSTNDCVFALANGASGVTIGEGELDLFVEALRQVCEPLAIGIVRGGEGATKLVTIEVTGGASDEEAKRTARAIANSPLVKTAVHGADPNWGRVAMAVGKCSDDEDIDQEKVAIRFGDLQLYPMSQLDPMSESSADDLDRLREVMAAERVDIAVDLGITPEGNGPRATVYGCDLSDGYVRINADYTT
jgi:glutamate N-acetyltransferase/amino-acid N-acetyltransferase